LQNIDRMVQFTTAVDTVPIF